MALEPEVALADSGNLGLISATPSVSSVCRAPRGRKFEIAKDERLQAPKKITDVQSGRGLPQSGTLARLFLLHSDLRAQIKRKARSRIPEKMDFAGAGKMLILTAGKTVYGYFFQQSGAGARDVS
jgi:hypothetical protein